MSKAVRDTIRRWEQKNMVWGLGYVDKNKGSGKSLSENMRSRGYDAMRVSPSVTTKFGLKYRAVYGGSVEPNYQMPQRKGKFFPRVRWYKQGYIKAGKSKGTVLLHRDLGVTFQMGPFRSQLMLKAPKKRRTVKRRRKK